ncbi:MAG TPA: FAD-dependent oxidoreductase [Acidimicrobiia bacterium]|nr:FAD-dependent oxidoreductase [Acidimicrobiia bacterium]
MNRYRGLSLWHDTSGEELAPRPGLAGAADVDVAIVGAGYTGLWSAYYLKRLQPDIRVAVLESEIAGFGASGRNGGWCSGEIAGNRRRMERRHGRSAVTALLREMLSTVDEIGRVVATEGIDCHFHKGGMLSFATNHAHFVSLHHALQQERAWGFGPEDYRWLGPAEVGERARIAGAQGALSTPHAAAVHPARLARGLARVVEAMGVPIYEQTRVERIQPGLVTTDHGVVRAPSILRCTEAFTVELPGERRSYLPVYSLMVATEPLPPNFWEHVGFSERQVFNDPRHLVIYGQRTVDGRLAFGGRGARYHFGSALRTSYERQPGVHAAVRRILWSLFPDLGDATITHEWGGAVAVPRDWRPSVDYDRAQGLGRAGGYVGEGVAAANLAGRTLADLVLERASDLVRLPWVGHRSRKWEPEPLRFLGANAASLLVPAADRAEQRSGRPSRILAGAFRLLAGK